MRELRHDFRRYYGVSYDDVELDEALDLVETLPAGSLFKASLGPVFEWSNERRMAADIANLLYICACRLSGRTDELSLPYTTPESRQRSAAYAEKSRRVRESIENTEWEEV